MKTTQITISTKKGENQTTTWGVWQNRPYPDIEGHSGNFRWRNFGGLFGEYGHPANGLGDTFSAVLLREGWTPETAKDNRHDYAGFEWNDYGQPKQTVPGAIVYRGKNLGETTAEIRASGGNGGVTFRVRGFDYAAGMEHDMLEAQVSPALVAFVHANRDALKAEAVKSIREQCETEIRKCRENITRLEQEAKKAIAGL